MLQPHKRFSHNPLFQLATAFAAGIVCASYLQTKWLYPFLLFAMTGLATVVAVCVSRLRIAGVLLLTTMFFAASCLTCLQYRSSSNQLKSLIQRGIVRANEPIRLTGTVSGPVELLRDEMHLMVNVETLSNATSTMECSGVVVVNSYFQSVDEEKRYRELNLQSGSRIAVATILDFTEQYRNPGVPTLAEYLETKSIDAIATISGPQSIIALNTRRHSFLTILYNWRASLQRQLDAHFSKETAGVLAAALLGNRHNLSTATAERFRDGGTFHILVISGAHISFLGAVTFLIARRLTSRRWLQFAISSTVVWLYTLAVGADVSVTRAALMFSFVVVGHLIFRPASPLNSLGLAAIVLLVWSPKDLFDPSLQLTFLSVLAIVALALPILQTMRQIGDWRPTGSTPYPPQCSRWLRTLSESLFWSDASWQHEQKKLNHSYRVFKTPLALCLERYRLQRLLRYLFAVLVVSVTVQAMLLPFQIVYFHRLSLSSLVLNVVVGVLLAILAAVALMALLIAQLSVALATPLFVFANTIDWLMVHSVDPFSRVGMASLRIPEYSGHARVLYAIYYVPLLMFAFQINQWKPFVFRSSGTQQEQGRIRFSMISAVQAMMFLLLLWHPCSVQSPGGKLQIDFLDVGQGDAALLTMPDGATVLVDGGGRPQFSKGASTNRQRSIGEMVVCEYLWHRGFDSIDYVVATHADADHIDGLNDVVRNFRVRSAIVGRTPSTDTEYAKFADTLAARHTPVQVIGAGDLLTFGDVSIDVLWPTLPTAADAPSRNNDSVVLRVRFGHRTFLLTGDIEKTAEEFLSNDLVKADVVKVAHHGSRTSSTELFVSAVHPRLAVISVGRKSMFGHPHAEVVERWTKVGAEVLTTGRSGMITVSTDGNSLEVTKFEKK